MAKENLFYSGGSKELASKRKALSCFKGRFISGRSPAYLLFNIFMAHESRIVRQAIKTWQQQQYSCQPPRSQFVRILPQLDMQAFDWHLTRFHARPVWVVRCSKDIGVFGVVIAVLLCCNHFQVKYRFPFLSARCCVWQINWLPSSEALQTVHLLLLFLMHCLFPSLLDPRFPLPTSHRKKAWKSLWSKFLILIDSIWSQQLLLCFWHWYELKAHHVTTHHATLDAGSSFVFSDSSARDGLKLGLKLERSCGRFVAANNIGPVAQHEPSKEMKTEVFFKLFSFLLRDTRNSRWTGRKDASACQTQAWMLIYLVRFNSASLSLVQLAVSSSGWL